MITQIWKRAIRSVFKNKSTKILQKQMNELNGTLDSAKEIFCEVEDKIQLLSIPVNEVHNKNCNNTNVSFPLKFLVSPISQE